MQENTQEKQQEWQVRTPPTITVHLQPANKDIVMPRPKTVMGLLKKLDIKPGTALVIRDGGLLTPDREILTNDEITVRIVISAG